MVKAAMKVLFDNTGPLWFFWFIGTAWEWFAGL